LFKAGDSEDLRKKMEYVIDNPWVMQEFRKNMPVVRNIQDNAREIQELYSKLTHSATSPNAWNWGIRAVSPKGLKEDSATGLSLSVSILRMPNIGDKPRCLPSGYSEGLTHFV
jgi:hypothetical protein